MGGREKEEEREGEEKQRDKHYDVNEVRFDFHIQTAVCCS